MVLVINCIGDDPIAQSFDRAISRPIKKAKMKVDFLRLSKIGEKPDLSRFSQYSHMIISGSEASVVEDNPWDDLLKEIIDQRVAEGMPLLGICYGHQFLARALLGKVAVRKSATPEFGWIEISLAENPLFAGITSPVFMVSHYDEACNLTGDFKILASSPRCGIHAFQYKDLPVWGVQFHPEYDIKEAEEIFDAVKKDDPKLPTYFFDTLRQQLQPKQNERIFLNFLKR
ncbi:MAG: hypothetical protein EHM45_24450 [Desulfobacteraceae bacterium]|nr:MAG: hypothetical protein EHM45_24450 [Desulfobacteraceae bacterium]